MRKRGDCNLGRPPTDASFTDITITRSIANCFVRPRCCPTGTSGSIFFWNAGTNIINPGQFITWSNARSGDFLNGAIPIPTTGTLSNLMVIQDPPVDNCMWTVYVGQDNASAQPTELSIITSASSNCARDTTHTVSVQPCDLVGIKLDGFVGQSNVGISLTFT